uniref:Phosphatidyl-N-methylethanolamine N-methyltransferase n=1 Tax=Araucaria cunninghamii TaxID=56994 RepID=A0A0D6RAF4_ARACU
MGVHTLFVCIAILLPFPFYYVLWTYPQGWMQCCGKGVDPSHRMAQISHILKALQIIALTSVAHFSWPPWYCLLLIVFGQYLNFKVFELLGESGTYYGVRFGKNIPWVTDFPFGYIKDPQYIGSILSLLGCLCWVPWQFVSLWIVGYLFMMMLESNEDSSTRAKIY